MTRERGVVITRCNFFTGRWAYNWGRKMINYFGGSSKQQFMVCVQPYLVAQ